MLDPGATRGPRASSALRVALATEGTYRFADGGVSTWCHTLCSALDDVEFALFAVTGGPDERARFELPGHVRLCELPLWPGEEPAVYLDRGNYADVVRRRFATGRTAIARDFARPLRVVVRAILRGDVPTAPLVAAFVHLSGFFAHGDYKVSMRSRVAWRVLTDELAAHSAEREALGASPATLADATLCARWLYHMLLPLATRVQPEVDVWHASIASPCALPAVVARHTLGTAFLLTEHGVYLRERCLAAAQSGATDAQRSFLVGLARALAQACYASADVIAPVAAYNTRWERALGAPTERVRVVYNGVDEARFRPRDAGAPAPRSRPTAVIAARVFPLKDIETLIRATAVARRAVPGVLVLVFGSLTADPAYVARCRALVGELGLEGSFEFRGPHEAPAEMFHEGDISVLSSVSEGFPYTVVESMACGVPVVATDVGGVSEAIGDTGLVVAPRAPEALGAAMAALLGDRDRAVRLGVAARARVLQSFTLARQLATYRALYDELAELTRARRPEAERAPAAFLESFAEGPPRPSAPPSAPEEYVPPELAEARLDAALREGETLVARSGLPVDAFDVAAALESEGARDDDVRAKFGASSVFAFASDVAAVARRVAAARRGRFDAGARGNARERWRERVAGRARRAREAAQLMFEGSTFAMPLLGQMMCVLLTGHSLCASADFDAERSTAAGLGLLGSFVATGGASTAAGREGAVARGAENFATLRDACARIVLAGLAVVGVAGGALAAAQALLGLLHPHVFWPALAYYVAFSCLWLALAMMRVVRLHVAALGLTVAGGLTVGAAVERLPVDELVVQLGVVGCVAAAALALAERRARALGAGSAVAGAPPARLPPPGVAAGLLVTYAAFGSGYSALLVSDRLFAWSAPGHALAQPLWFHTAYEVGMDWALVSLIPPLAYLELVTHRFFVKLREAQGSHRLVGEGMLDAELASVFDRALVRVVAIGAASVACAWLAARGLATLVGEGPLREFLADPRSTQVFWSASLGYQLLALGLCGSLVLFSLNRPVPALKAVARGVVVAVIVSFALSRLVSPEASALGFVAGAAVFAHGMLVAARAFVRDASYRHFASF